MVAERVLPTTTTAGLRAIRGLPGPRLGCFIGGSTDSFQRIGSTPSAFEVIVAIVYQSAVGTMSSRMF